MAGPFVFACDGAGTGFPAADVKGVLNGCASPGEVVTAGAGEDGVGVVRRVLV